MKDFDDFKGSFDPSWLSSRAASAAIQSAGYGPGMELPPDVLPLVVGRVAAEVTMGCLREYHSWLAPQLRS